MELERKIVFRILLTYVVFGVSYIFSLKAFIVPLPIVYLAVPLVSLYFLWLSRTTVFGLFFLILPLIVLKDLFLEWHPIIGFSITILSLIAWVFLGFLILIKYSETSKCSLFFGWSLVASLLTLFPFSFNLSLVVLPIIGVSSLLYVLDFNPIITTESGTNTKQQTVYRIALLIVLISGFYTLTLISMLSNL